MACRARVLRISIGKNAQHHIAISTSPWQPEGFAAALLGQLYIWGGQQIEKGVWP